MASVIRKLRRALLNQDPSFCDMYEDEPCRRVAEEYLGHIRRRLRDRFGENRLTVLDAGCQAGRLLIPLAADGHTMIGIDTSAFALRRAAQHARGRGLSIRLHRGNIAHLKRWIRPESLEAVICAEVLYLCRNFRELIQVMAGAVKPGGLLFVSHRPALYYVAIALRRGQVELANELMRRTEGRSPDGDYHNWQTPEQLHELYQELRLTMLGCEGLDRMELTLDLSMADDAVKTLLAPTHLGDSRFQIPTYLLVAAQKP